MMRQPRKDVLREQLALAADEIIRLRLVLNDARQAAIVRLQGEFNQAMFYPGPPRRWWRRFAWWRK